ncbi:MAG: SPOR domain-containing protein [Caulobacter sp.]|nr:SPOR domain-containing protein [Caulobacter sp.]
MSDHDRGAYTPPTDSPLTFDARRPVRGGGPNSSTLMISAVILVLLVAGAGFWLYKDGQRGAGDEPRPVGAVVAGTRAPPPAQAQPQPEDESAGLQIYKQDEDLAASTPTFAPGPEAVQPRPAPQARPTAPVESAALRPAQPAAATPRPVQVAVATPKPTAPVAPKATGGAAMVQIGAFSSEALADRGWNDAATVAPGLAAGKGKRVEPIDKDGKTLYRTSVTGFASRAEAQTFCERLKGAGKSCFVK